MKTKQIKLNNRIMDYSNEIAVCGNENNFIKQIALELSSNGIFSYKDFFGNLIVSFSKNNKINENSIVFSAHVDEIGIQIQKVEDEKVYFRGIGTIKTQALNNNKVSINNLETTVFSHSKTLKDYEYNKLYIKKRKDEVFNIGDFGTFSSKSVLNNDLINGKALDNRVGCALLFEVALYLHENDLEENIFVIFSVQEEIGARGIQHFSYLNKMKYFISLDATPVVPENNVLQSRGVCIKLSDGSSFADEVLFEAFKQIAENNKIPYQIEVNDLGLTESAFPPLFSQTKSLTISYPITDMHTNNSSVDINDVVDTYNLIVKCCKDRNYFL